MDEPISNEDALNQLDAIDAKHGINKPIEKNTEITTETVKSLGKARGHGDIQMSDVEESPWKLLSLDLLPSRGMFYPDGIELLIRSAKTKDIRHWSTMDEHDPIDVREKISFILNKCTRFKVRGNPAPLNFNDYSDVDRYHILFRIYELTFPNQENKLMANIKCSNTKCGHMNRIQITSRNLIGFEIPEELYQWYSPEEKCFVVPSEKLGETLRFYIPTSGISNKIKQAKKADGRAGLDIDESFYSIAPYLLNDWRGIGLSEIKKFKIDTSNSWSEHKFTVLYKFTEALKKASLNRATGVCEKCKTRLESHVFSSGSFTVKDIFIISTGLNELI